MSLIRLRFVAAAMLGVALSAHSAAAITTSTGQLWNFEPDAWTRGNDADTSHFGWDVIESGGNPLLPPQSQGGFTRVLDDSTPDLGGATMATGTRIYQGTNGVAEPSPTMYGHRLGSFNYYSFLDTANDTITATAPASGLGGYTTVVLQLIETAGGDGLIDLMFAMDNSVDTWTLAKHLHSANGNGSGVHWVEWYAPGNDLTFKITMTSSQPHRAIDAFQVDTFWTPDIAPVLNAITAIPEPAGGMLLGAALFGGLAIRRRRAG